MNLNNEQISEIMNQTFERIAFFHRDTDLTDKQFSAYKIGQILQERGFVDSSHRGGGIIQNHRFLIVSSFAKDISMFEHGTNWGLMLILNDSFFKVLDIFDYQNKKQITLLHIPKEGIDIFAQSDIDIEKKIVEGTRKYFEQDVIAPVTIELTTNEWKERVKSPIGINNNGEPFFEYSLGTSNRIKDDNEQHHDKKVEPKKGFWTKLFGK